MQASGNRASVRDLPKPRPVAKMEHSRKQWGDGVIFNPIIEGMCAL